MVEDLRQFPYYKCMLHLQEKKICLNYPYIIFGGNPCGLKVFDSSMVNEPSGFDPLKFYCIWHAYWLFVIYQCTKVSRVIGIFLKLSHFGLCIASVEENWLLTVSLSGSCQY